MSTEHFRHRTPPDFCSTQKMCFLLAHIVIAVFGCYYLYCCIFIACCSFGRKKQENCPTVQESIGNIVPVQQQNTYAFQQNCMKKILKFKNVSCSVSCQIAFSKSYSIVVAAIVLLLSASSQSPQRLARQNEYGQQEWPQELQQRFSSTI